MILRRASLTLGRREHKTQIMKTLCHWFHAVYFFLGLAIITKAFASAINAVIIVLINATTAAAVSNMLSSLAQQAWRGTFHRAKSSSHCEQGSSRVGKGAHHQQQSLLLLIGYLYF